MNERASEEVRPEPGLRRDIRCEHCGTLLARAALIVGEIEIKCRRCGRRTLVRSAANEAA